MSSLGISAMQVYPCNRSRHASRADVFANLEVITCYSDMMKFYILFWKKTYEQGKFLFFVSNWPKLTTLTTSVTRTIKKTVMKMARKSAKKKKSTYILLMLGIYSVSVTFPSRLPFCKISKRLALIFHSVYIQNFWHSRSFPQAALPTETFLLEST